MIAMKIIQRLSWNMMYPLSAGIAMSIASNYINVDVDSNDVVFQPSVTLWIDYTLAHPWSRYMLGYMMSASMLPSIRHWLTRPALNRFSNSSPLPFMRKQQHHHIAVHVCHDASSSMGHKDEDDALLLHSNYLLLMKHVSMESTGTKLDTVVFDIAAVIPSRTLDALERELLDNERDEGQGLSDVMLLQLKTGLQCMDSVCTTALSRGVSIILDADQRHPLSTNYLSALLCRKHNVVANDAATSVPKASRSLVYASFAIGGYAERHMELKRLERFLSEETSLFLRAADPPLRSGTLSLAVVIIDICSDGEKQSSKESINSALCMFERYAVPGDHLILRGWSLQNDRLSAFVKRGVRIKEMMQHGVASDYVNNNVENMYVVPCGAQVSRSTHIGRLLLEKPHLLLTRHH